MKKLLALLLALLLSLSCAFAEEETIDPYTEVMNVGGISVTLMDAAYYANVMYQYGMISTPNDFLTGLEYCLLYDVAPKLVIDSDEMITELLSEEEIEDVKKYCAEQYSAYIDEFVAANMTEETDEETLRAQALEAIGLTEEEYINGTLKNEAYNVLMNGIDANVTEEELNAFHEEQAALEMASVTSVMMYEYYENYMGYEFAFRPEGYRGVLHILLSADKELLDAYNNAADAEEKLAAETAILASLSEKTDEIYARLDAGESFESLIAVYGEDPGMQAEENLKNGYAVHADSMVYVQEFTDGAFSEKMTEVGSVSDPIVSSYGVHIMYYLRDIPGGIVEMTDSLREEYASLILNNRMLVAVREWLAPFEVTYTEAYDLYIGEANFLSR